jgi:uncharacterized protein
MSGAESTAEALRWLRFAREDLEAAEAALPRLADGLLPEGWATRQEHPDPAALTEWAMTTPGPVPRAATVTETAEPRCSRAMPETLTGENRDAARRSSGITSGSTRGWIGRSFPPRYRVNTNLPVDAETLADFCTRHGIRKLSLFGSALKGTARPDSDIDLLVEFEPDAVPDLLSLVEMEDELTTLAGRRVDMRTAGDLSRYFRDEVLRTAEVQYARG